MLTICIIMTVLNIANLVFAIIERMNFNRLLTIFKYIGISLSIVFTMTTAIFCTDPNCIPLCVIFMSIMFLLCPVQLALNAIFMHLSERKIFKYLTIGSNAIQSLLIIIFCILL